MPIKRGAWIAFVKAYDPELWAAAVDAGLFEDDREIVRVEDADINAWIEKKLVPDPIATVFRDELLLSFNRFSGRAMTGKKFIPLFKAAVGGMVERKISSGRRGFRGWRLLP